MANNLTPAPPQFPARPSDLGSDHGVTPPEPPAGGWAVSAGRGMDWWKEGWRLFTAAPMIWIVITVLFFVIMFGLALIPFIGQIASTLLYPVLGAGILIGSRALDRGGQLTIGHLFSCFNDKAVPLIVVALLYFGGWLVIWMIAAVILVSVAGLGTLTSLMSGDPFEAGVDRNHSVGRAAADGVALCPADHGLLVCAGAGGVPRRRTADRDEIEFHRVDAQYSAVPRVLGTRSRVCDHCHDTARARLDRVGAGLRSDAVSELQGYLWRAAGVSLMRAFPVRSDAQVDHQRHR
jgi:hypothetical protein